MSDTLKPKSSADDTVVATDDSKPSNDEAPRALSLVEAHRLATLAALQLATSDAARARHARKKWGRR